MTRPPLRGAAPPLLLAALLGLGCCSLLTSFDESKMTEDTFERCRDSIDNDGDSLVDCDDTGCALFSVCTELTPAACRDGQDNDGDSLVDCQDPGCASLPAVCAEQTQQACADGVDNDGDTLVDCNDPDCRAIERCQEMSGAACSDGQDNDQDGLVDCADFDCYRAPSCCNQTVPSLAGDDFTYASSKCTIRTCLERLPICCTEGYDRCNPFDPSRWIAWGLPRARQDDGAFAANEPCGCEASGIVSVESVPLRAGLVVEFDLSLLGQLAAGGAICGGLSLSTTFVDDLQQCAGTPSPRLLLGLCLEEIDAASLQLTAVVDGQVQERVLTATSGPFHGALRLTSDGVELSAGSLAHRTIPIDPALTRALVLIYGRGTAGRLRNLSIKQPESFPSRCADPAAWYRHLARGEPVLPDKASPPPLAAAARPSVVYRPEAKDYLMLFSGTPTAGSPASPRIYAATSPDGTTWTTIPEPILSPREGASFGHRQDSPSLLLHQGKLHLWYTREDDIGSFTQQAIAYAQSTDGLEWTPVAGPDGGPYVLTPSDGSGWDSLAVSSPSVIVGPEGGFLMWYTGTAIEISPRPAIGAARSPDGVRWAQLQDRPALEPRPGTADLACEEPAVIHDARRGVYQMWYTHRAFGLNPSIHFAVSPDGLTWIRWPQGAALPVGPLGTFDERSTEAPAVLGGEVIQLWYTGVNSKGRGAIGYAENRGSF